MAIDLPAIAASLRAGANVMHRGSNGRLRRGHPFRRTLPRQTPPTAIAAEYARGIRGITTDAIRQAVKPLLDALPRLVKGHALAVRSDDGEIDQVELLVQHAESAVRDRLGPVHMNAMARYAADQVGRKNAHQLGQQIKALVGVDVPARARAEDHIVRAFALENAKLITSISSQSMDQIARVVTRGMSSGKSAEEIAADIHERIDVGDSRVDLIASDQLGKLQGQLNHARQQELGISHFTWRHGGSEDPRPEHEKRDGRIFAYDDFDPDELPGQPINCSCFAEPVVDLSFLQDR